MKLSSALLSFCIVTSGCKTLDEEETPFSAGFATPGAPQTGWEPPKSRTEQEAWQIYNRAMELERMGRPESLVVAKQAVETLSPSDSDLANGSLRQSVASMMVRKGNYKEAKDLSLEALPYAQKGSDFMGIAAIYVNIGDAYEGLNDVPNRNKYWRLGNQTIQKHNLGISLDSRLEAMNDNY